MGARRSVALWLVVFAAPAWAASAQAPVAEAVPRLLRAGDPGGALRLVDEAIAQMPGDARLWTLRGLALIQMDRAEEGLAAFRRALSEAPAYLPALQGAAQVQYRTRSPEAQTTLERIVAIDPADVVAHAMLGALAYDRRDCTTAVGHFDRAEPAIRGNPQALWQAAHCLFVLDRPADAARTFQRVLDTGALGPPMADLVAFNLALAMHTAGRPDQAIATLEPLARQQPDRDILALLADAYAANQQLERAITILRQATAIYPRDEDFYVALGALCLESDSFELGREIIDVGLTNVPDSARLYALRGVIHAQLGAFDMAQADFERVSQLEPGQSAAIAGLTLTLQQTGQVEKSLTLLREQARVRPDDHIVNLLLAQTLLRGAPEQAELGEARSALMRAVAAAPRVAQVRTELGKLFLKTGDTQNAIEHLQQAIELDPSDKTATNHLLLALKRAGRTEEAQKLVVRVRSLLDQEKASEVARNRYRLVKAEPDDARNR